MDKIFIRESKNLLIALDKYINKEISYDDLNLANIRYEISKFESIQKYKDEIHNFKLKQYKKALDFEKTLEVIKKQTDVDVDLKEIINRGFMLGYANKSEYVNLLPVYPTLDMITFRDIEVFEADEKVDEIFDFEF